MTRTARSDGFTLIEVVLALVILSLIALMLYSAFDTGHRAVIAGEREADLNQRARLAEEIIGRQLRSAVIYWAHDDDDQFPYFVGRPDGVSFVSSAPQGRGGTGLAVVTYRVVDDQLVLEERSAFSPDDLFDPRPDSPIARAVLISGIQSILFEYTSRDENEATWQRAWDAQEEDALPSAVRLTIEGLPFFKGAPWTQVVPLMTVAAGWGNDDAEPPDEDLQTENDNGSGNENMDDTTEEAGTDNDE